MDESAATKAIFRKASRRELKLLGKIMRAHEAGKLKRARYFTRLYLLSRDARIVATVRANRGLKLHRRVPAARLVTIAEKLDPWRGSAESVTVHFKPKADDEHDSDRSWTSA